MTMKKAVPYVVYVFACALVFALMLEPSIAFAAELFPGAGAKLKTTIFNFIAPFAGLAVIVIGCIFLSGTVRWMVIGLIVLGIGVIFGHEQILGVIRSMWSV